MRGERERCFWGGLGVIGFGVRVECGSAALDKVWQGCAGRKRGGWCMYTQCAGAAAQSAQYAAGCHAGEGKVRGRGGGGEGERAG